MKSKFMMLLAFLAVFSISAPVIAAPPEADAAAATGETKDEAPKADAATGEAKAEEKAPEAKEEAPAATGDGDGKDKPAEVKTDEEAMEAAQSLFTAIQQKHWGLALGLGLSLLVFGLRKVKLLDKVPSKALPWVTAVLGVVGYIAAALMTEGASMTDALVGGATTGIAAVGLWEMLLKHFLKKAESEKEAESSDT